MNIGHVCRGITGGTKDGAAGLQATPATSGETHSLSHTHLAGINTATATLIFNCVDGLHLCCSVMQTLLYVLSGLIVIRPENLIKLNNKGDCSIFFSFPLRRILTLSAQ